MRNLILAGSHLEYENSFYYPHDRYVSKLEDMYGYSDTLLIKLGTWYTNWDWQEMLEIKNYCETHNIRIERE